MLSRGGKAGTEIRGRAGHTDADEKVLLRNFGIFTTPLCLLCGCWQSHIHAGAVCLLLLPPACGATSQNVGFSERTISHILPPRPRCCKDSGGISNVWTIFHAVSSLLCVRGVTQTWSAWRSVCHLFMFKTTVCSCAVFHRREIPCERLCNLVVFIPGEV